MKNTRWLVLGLAVALLSACGGGGGGTGNGGNGSGSAGNPNASSFAIPYSGLTSQALLTQKNAMSISSNLYALLDIAVTISGTPAPWYLPPNSTASSQGSDVCTSGTIDVHSSTPNQNSQIDKVVFHACQMDGVTFDGGYTQELDVSQNGATQTQTTTIDSVSVSDGSDIQQFSGSITFNSKNLESPAPNGNYIISLVVKSKTLGRTFKLDNVAMDVVASSLAGRFYDSQEGFVDLSAEDGGPHLYLNGANHSMIALKPLHQNGVGVDHMVVDLSSPEISPFGIDASMTIDQFENWSFEPNNPPEIISSPDEQTVRLDPLIVNVGGNFSDPTDLLSYDYQIVSSPSNCGSNVQVQALDQIQATFDCYGQYTLAVTAFDGFHQTKQELKVTVLPRPAEFIPIPTQESDAGQNLLVPVAFSNASEDGPFDVSLLAAPDGVQVTPDGNISGEPSPLLQEGTTQFSIALKADHVQSSQTSFTWTYNGVKKVPTMQLAHVQSGCYSTWVTVGEFDHPVRLCLSDASLYIEGLVNGELQTDVVWLRPPWNQTLRGLLWADVTGDGNADVIAIAGQTLYVLNPITQQVVREISLPFQPGTFEFRGSNVDARAVNSARLIVHVYTDNTYYLVDLQSGEVSPYSVPEGIRLYDDITGSGQKDLLLSSGKIVDLNGNPEGQIYTPDPYELFFLCDVDGDGESELVGSITDDFQVSYEPRVRVVKPGDLSHYQEFSISSPLPQGQAWTPHLDFADVDGQPGAEVIAHQQGQHMIYVYKLQNGGFNLIGSIALPSSLYDDDKAIPLQGLGNGKSYLKQSNSFGPYMLDWQSQAFSTVIDHRQPLSLSDQTTHRFFRESTGDVTAFIADIHTLQQLSFDSQGKLKSVTTTNAIANPDANNVVRAQVAGNGNNQYYYLQFLSPSTYALYNVATGALDTTINLQSSTQTSYALRDVNGDGQLDLITSDDAGCIAWYRVGHELAQQPSICAPTEGTVQALKAVDMDGDGINEILRLSAWVNGFELQVFKTGAGGLELSKTFRMYDNDVNGKADLALQNVDGDAGVEAVVSVAGANLYEFKPTGLLRKIRVNAVFSLPDFTTSQPAHALIAVGSVPGTAAGAGGRFRMMEISPITGTIIWSSLAYPGDLNASGLYWLNNQVDGRGYIAISTDGLLTF